MNPMPQRALIAGRRLELVRVLAHVAISNKRAIHCADERGEQYFATLEEWAEGAAELERTSTSGPLVTTRSHASEKIALFRSLFKGRTDVYAHGYRKRDGGIGYSPACTNEFARGVCPRATGQKTKCADCPHRSFKELDDRALIAHFRGNDERWRDVLGIYVVNMDNTTSVLVADFDDKGWKDASAAYRDAARSLGLDVAIERSRSGDGGHAWIFFERPISAKEARRLGSAIMAKAMEMSASVSFSAFDRLFPAQDTIPSGGFGSLIALPLQGAAQRQGNSVFVDNDFKPYADQWMHLSSVRKTGGKDISRALANAKTSAFDAVLGGGGRKASADAHQPTRRNLSSEDFPEMTEIRRSDMLYVSERGLSSAALSRIKLLAAFANPAFYKAQARHQSVYQIPRVASLGEKRGDSVALPRGCEKDLVSLLDGAGARFRFSDERWNSRPIDVAFTGALRPAQQAAAEALLAHEDGILSAPTGFGKTVIGAYLIATVKAPTLVIVPKTALLSQWVDRLGEFLDVREEPAALLTKSGRPSKRKRPRIGRLGGGKSSLSGIVDVATFQSLIERASDGSQQVKDLVSAYGMVICDECHHAAAPQLERVLKSMIARRVYGLSATPRRSDGLDRALQLLCGPIRHKVSAKDQASEQSFSRMLAPRLTGVRLPGVEPGTSFNQVLDLLCGHPARNALIADDVLRALGERRTVLVATKRKAHARELERLIMDGGGSARLLVGEGTARQRREAVVAALEASAHGPLAIVATESYLGEGFDMPQLEDLFLATPISWDGSVVQQSGRLHREHEGKTSVIVHDYVDAAVPMLARMYKRRLKVYASLGYELLGEGSAERAAGSFVLADGFRVALEEDLDRACRSIALFASYVSERFVGSAADMLRRTTARGVAVTCVICGNGFDESVRNALEELGVAVRADSSAQPGLAVFDEKIVWYGSLPLLGFPRKDDCSVRFESAEIAHELLGQAGSSCQ